MLKLNDVYQLPGTPVDLNYGLRTRWLPEVGEAYGPCFDAQACAEMVQEARVEVRCLFERNFEGDRFADMHTLWFDGKPVMVVRDGGRGGRDFNDRMITDEAAFLALCQYIRQKLKTEVDATDVVDPERQFYPEELFNFYGGTDFAAELGYVVEPKTPGFQLFPDAERIIPNAPAGHILVEAKPEVGDMPSYLRRGGFVMQRVRALTDEELARNPRVLEASTASGHTRHFWYVGCEAPAGVAIVKV